MSGSQRIIETLFDTMVATVYDGPVPKDQLIEIRRAFFAGAKGLFDTLVLATDPGTEPTERDLAMMDAVSEELNEFGTNIGTEKEAANLNTKPLERLGDAPVEEQYRVKMQAIAMTLDEFLNPGQKRGKRENGFVLLVYPFGDKAGRCNYISNGANRTDVATLMEEQAKRFREQAHG